MEKYSTLVKDSINSVYQTNVANKILQFMDKIRNESDDNQARRFVMELLQNARDLAYVENGRKIPVSVRVRLTDNELEFCHSGKVFSVKDILSIINQVSSKKPGEGIGQFGTGFMSTYQLSEIVELKSFIKDADNPYKKFSITIDRTGHDKQAILDGISRSLEMLYEVDSSADIPEAEFDRTAYNTAFSYHLDNERSRRIAAIGVNDMENTLPYILLFSEGIGKVELVLDTVKDRKNVVYTSIENRALSNGLWQKLIRKECNGEKEIISLLYEQMLCGSYDEMLALACCNREKNILPMNERTPRLYIDFPLIGSESFPFPMVLNSRGLHSNEPRSGISLVDNETSVDAVKNKKLVNQAVELYGHFLENLVDNGYEGLDNIMHMPVYEQSREWSESWVKSNLYDGILKKVSDKRIFVSTDGRYSLDDYNFRLVRAGSTQERKCVQKLISCMKNIRVPVDDIQWESVLEGYDISGDKWYDLRGLLTNAGQLAAEELDTDRMSVEEWIGEVYKAAMESEALANEIKLGNIPIFLNQKYEQGKPFELKSFREIKYDPGIPEFLKDTAQELDKLKIMLEEPLDIRSVLLHKDFPIDKDNMLESYETDRIINYIIKKSDRNCRVVNYAFNDKLYMNAWKNAWMIMLANGPDDRMKKLAEKYWDVELKKHSDEETQDGRLQDYVWKPTYSSVLMEMFTYVYNKRELSFLCLDMNTTENEVIGWLNDLYSEGIEYIREDRLRNMYVVLNQKGHFTASSLLKIDRIDENLKNIIEAFKDKESRCNIAECLVDKRISLNGWNLSEYDNETAASVINSVVQQLLATASLSESKPQYQDACTALLGWIDENNDTACILFPAFYKDEDRMKLLTTRAAVNLNRKVKKLDASLEKLGAADTDDALKHIEDLRQELEKTKEALDKAENAAEKSDSEEENTKLGQYDSDSDIFFGGDDYLYGLSDSELFERLRAIGDAGEKYGYDSIIDRYIASGYTVTSRESGRCIMERRVRADLTERAEICRPDTASYHQAGWDVSVTLSHIEPSEARVVSTEYYEIKTNTATSIYCDNITISDEQMKKAITEREHYHILRLHCNSRTLAITDETMYDNPMKLLADGKFLNMDKGLRLYER